MNTRLKNLKDVMAVQSTSYNVKRMNEYIKAFVKDVPNTKLYKNNGNLYVTRGQADIYPCIVSHTDTVHDIHKEFNVQRHKDVLYAIKEDYARAGIGGDDKVGIFVALEALRTTENIKVAFFRDEEVGCVGSKLADMTFFTDVAFVLQCDRRGYSDFVNEIMGIKLFTEEFSDAIAPLLEKYNRVETNGGMTDVWQLAEKGLDVACANMSCGYYDPHTDNEYIKISEVFRTLDFCMELVDNFGNKRWIVPADDRSSYGSFDYGGSYNPYGSWGGGSYNGYGSGWSRTGNTKTRYSNGRIHYHDTSKSITSPTDAFDPYEEDIDGIQSKPKPQYCLMCDSKTPVEYDDTVGMHWCFDCHDYVREELVDTVCYNTSGTTSEDLPF